MKEKSFNEQELMEMMEKDASIDESNLAAEAIKTHQLYTKYQRLFYFVTNKLIDCRQELNQKRCNLFEYWLGKADDKVYRDKPKQQRVNKTDVELYIKADPEYCLLERKLNKLELIANMIDNYLKQIANRNFAIKNAIDYEKFKNGGY